ncbi:MAG: heparan N-sulfatase [Gammaproteobacteria bacterium]|nr:MAG: heparan N-sulfatase [Gammaproteobacteria bacterium]
MRFTRLTFTVLASMLMATACSQSEHPVTEDIPTPVFADESMRPATPANLPKRPNLLFILTDDQSWEFTGKAGYPLVKTPNFDRLANGGVYFKQAYVAAPTCTGSRASILSGRHVWNTGSAAMIMGDWPKGLITYQDQLAKAGYHVGYTGKGWGPGFFQAARTSDPAGTAYVDKLKFTPDSPEGQVRSIWDFIANFQSFLDDKPSDAPFSFWIGTFEPHRPYVAPDVSRFEGHDPATFIPGWLPDTPEIRKALSSYLIETEWFDDDLGAIIAFLEEKGLLDNTLIIIAGDNGADLPGAKPQNYEPGVRVPMLAYWKNGIANPGRDVADIASLIDIAPTFLEAAGAPIPPDMAGHSLLNILGSPSGGLVDPTRTSAFTGYERHSDWRLERQTYPRRAIHTPRYAYIRNYDPDGWPAGDPPVFAESSYGWLWDPSQNKLAEPFYTKLTAKRPRDELYDLERDPFQLQNIAADSRYKSVLSALSKRLNEELSRTGDPVHAGNIRYFEQFVRDDMKTVMPSYLESQSKNRASGN